jgi:hypothetical protein
MCIIHDNLNEADLCRNMATFSQQFKVLYLHFHFSTMDIINDTVLLIICRYLIVKSMFIINCDNCSKHCVPCY